MAAKARGAASNTPSGNSVNIRCLFRIAFSLVIIGLMTTGCAAFLEDYQYNPAGPLYQINSSNY